MSHYELPVNHDESLQPYVDMIDKFSYVEKAYFAKRALELEAQRNMYKVLYEDTFEKYKDTLQKRDQWFDAFTELSKSHIAAKAEIERLKKEQYRRADQENFNDGKNGYNPGHWSV